MSDEFSRRSFVKGAALAVGPAVLPVLGANNRLRVGWIGTGSRGSYLLTQAYTGSPELFTVTAVCDAFQGAIAKAKDQVMSKENSAPKTFVDYRELLADPSIDAVIIATPEHLHHSMAIAALRAGKHIYLEKPLAHTIEEGFEILREAEKAGKVVQVGTQNRSNSLYIKAKEMIAEGLIGDVHYVRAFWYRNSLDTEPAWRYAIQEGLSEQTADWEKFLGPARKRPFDPRRYRQWRLYWDYSGGISTDLLVHQTDITNFVCGKTVPYSCMASGGIYRWTDPDDDREVPDTFSALYEYPDSKFHLNYSCYFGNRHFDYGEQFMGNDGMIEVIGRQYLNYYPEKVRGPQIAARKPINLHVPNNDNLAVQAHIKNFLESVLGKAKPVAPATVGQEAAIGGHMATLSYRRGRKIIWDQKTQKYRFV
ncbi:MAG TPA: Gfo/Idh/MocA family oxidoreductase [Bryobacteraceae bacterium]|nr:Gfo/Idh/MocA family oxidoreductase [Bryobacteraceae bacterium]HOQ44105.1 Gfo/Idh/MocA family oxidoreductase [Bryobacteraceae bacterium]HPQ16035.1 Gfo/Idh/MocA family oxidoreductase [Bryobacteraceae bacterium]HPU70423.1 Gfo/Idh/MocA family oxidoreductase [Bryobacteraceae bacterium]